MDMLNLVYEGSRDQVIYDRLSSRMKHRFDIFGQLPDTLEDEWIGDEARLEEELRKYADRKRQANAFDIRWVAPPRVQHCRWTRRHGSRVGKPAPECWRARTSSR
ncbi:hypothetical protein GCM10011504_46000 [Siccirubricoccus deserti]|uniref:Uncharacterized protein n=1 Tax=Siccirubricoccus deserti TaxID=2013562 RepID=A0A9X0R423_9PROT|nr:hypothetical protein [Siccirubricoccus deserti]MBC4018048.1 hypothetical protein [Siccirubricoccus deserti]GGC62583.1 hypothetical protein GCM10011504_46000 [Siccirubricoccus deserti]